MNLIKTTMTTFILVFFAVAVAWLWLTVLAIIFLSGAASRLEESLRRKSPKRSSGLGKWLRVQGKL